MDAKRWIREIINNGKAFNGDIYYIGNGLYFMNIYNFPWIKRDFEEEEFYKNLYLLKITSPDIKENIKETFFDLKTISIFLTDVPKKKINSDKQIDYDQINILSDVVVFWNSYNNYKIYIPDIKINVDNIYLIIKKGLKLFNNSNLNDKQSRFMELASYTYFLELYEQLLEEV